MIICPRTVRESRIKSRVQLLTLLWASPPRDPPQTQAGRFGGRKMLVLFFWFGKMQIFPSILSFHLHFTCCIYSPDPLRSNRVLVHKSHAGISHSKSGLWTCGECHLISDSWNQNPQSNKIPGDLSTH